MCLGYTLYEYKYNKEHFMSNMDREDSVFIEDSAGFITIDNLKDASIRAQMEKLPTKVYSYYKTIKEALTTNNKVLSRIYIGKECFYVSSETIAKFNIIDNQLYFYAKLTPDEIGQTTFFSPTTHNVDLDKVLTLIIVTSEKDFKKALELVFVLKQKYCI